MTFVAARTDSIRIAPNVLNVPLRPPAVVARSAASLDLLSRRPVRPRASAPAGSGTPSRRWAARRLTPGQAVTALDEAIDVIRALWDTERAPRCVHRGQAPPRARREARAAPRRTTSRSGSAPTSRGCCADRPQGRRVAAFARVHAARRPRAGQRRDRRGGGVGRSRPPRDPPAAQRRAARRGAAPSSPSAWPTLALEDGICTFILAGDDPRAAPALRRGGRARHVREMVARERRATGHGRRRLGAQRPRSRPAATASRTTTFPKACDAIEPGDFDYAEVRATYMRGGAPGHRAAARIARAGGRGDRVRAPASGCCRSRCAAAATASAAAARTTAAS